jgi:ribonuclease BN (tRNA processing enzyme)
LLRAADCTLAVDFGSGVFSRLRERIDPAQLDAVVISHMHADHFFDIVPLRYALRYELERDTPLPVFLPPGGIRAARAIGNTLKETADFFDGVFDLHEYTPERPLELAGCEIRFAPTVHYIPAYAMRIDARGAIVGYSADTAPCDAVADLVRGADVFLCEAGLGSDGKESGPRGHLNAGEAGDLAQRAGVRGLVLTHYSAHAEPEILCAAAARRYSGEIIVADDGMEFPVR